MRLPRALEKRDWLAAFVHHMWIDPLTLPVAKAVLQTLTPREDKVLRLRLGLGQSDSGDPCQIECRTLKQVGEHFAVCAERVRAIEAKALRKLRHPSRGQVLAETINAMTDRETAAAIQVRLIEICDLLDEHGVLAHAFGKRWVFQGLGVPMSWSME